MQLQNINVLNTENVSMITQLYRFISILSAVPLSSKHHLSVKARKASSLTLAVVSLLAAQSVMAWGTSPSSGSTYTWNGWGSNLLIQFEGDYVEAIPPGDRLQVEIITEYTPPDENGDYPNGYCSDSTSPDTPCLRVYGLAPACIDASEDGDCYGDTVVLARLDVSIDPVKVRNNVYTASGKKTHVDGEITCEEVLSPAGATCPDGFPAAAGLPKGGNPNKLFPATTVFLQGVEVDLEGGQLLYLAGPLDQPKGPVLRHCYEQGIEPGTGVVDCGTPQALRTAQGELPPFIGGLDFESTTTNLNIGKNAEFFAIHVNLLSQTNADGLAFFPEQIDFNKPLAAAGECEAVLGQITYDDYNGDGIMDARVRFDGGCLVEQFANASDGDIVDITIRGSLLDGVQFEGAFSVNIIAN
jgi:hypothetical protein